MRLVNSSKQTLATNLTQLLATKSEMSRLALSKHMGVADGTLGRIKYGTGNPTVEVLDQIADFFKMPSWQLLKPREEASPDPFAKLIAMSTPRSRTALDAISRAAEEGRLTEADLLLLQRIAQRFMGD